MFKNKVVWITGASGGIGEALAYAFAREGARLVLSARKLAELDRVKANCTASPEVLVLPLDVTDFDLAPLMTQTVLDKLGAVDILINNAGISQRSYAEETDLSVDRRIMDINYFGTVALTKAVLPHLLEKQSGHIVNISSVMGKIGTPLRSAYAASKHALHGFFDCLRAEVYERNVRILMVCPGLIKTNISKNSLTGDGGTYDKMDDGQANGLAPEKLAARILSAIKNGKDEIYVGGKEVGGIYLQRYAPGVLRRVVRKMKVT